MVLSSQKSLSILRRSLTPNRPYHVQWFLTRRCNYRCRGCNVWREKPNGRELSADEIKEGLDVLRKLGTIEVVFSGGNPLLRDDIDEILGYASKHFITTVYDNGSLAAKKIDALREVDFVAISLDTLNEKLNDYVKGVPGSWKKSIEAIEKLHKKGVPVTVSPTISQLNLQEIVDFTEHFTDYGIPVWYCLYSYDTSDKDKLFAIGKRDNEFEIIDREAFAEVCDTLKEMKKERNGIFITNRTLTTLRNYFLTGRRTWKCQALDGFFMIDHLGRVAGCHCISPVASVFELLDVWESAKFEKLRKEYKGCDRCYYLCYIVYSLHSSVMGNIEIIRDQWRNAKLLLPQMRVGSS
jgi:MoaA/NifB/PqqE/SkfB family radical SAM enzyme